MKNKKIFVDGVSTEISLGIDPDEIETNEIVLDDTIDLENITEIINKNG